MAPKRPKGVPSDRDLQKLWREAVLLEWGGKCALESMDCQGTLECHHIKKRRVPHLRHVSSNGVPLCKYHHRTSRVPGDSPEDRAPDRREHYGVARYDGAEIVSIISITDSPDAHGIFGSA